MGAVASSAGATTAGTMTSAAGAATGAEMGTSGLPGDAGLEVWLLAGTRVIRTSVTLLGGERCGDLGEERGERAGERGSFRFHDSRSLLGAGSVEERSLEEGSLEEGSLEAASSPLRSLAASDELLSSLEVVTPPASASKAPAASPFTFTFASASASACFSNIESND